MPILENLGLKTKAYVGAAIATAAFAILAAIFFAAQANQKALLDSIESQYFSRAAAFSANFSELSRAHAAIFDVLATAAHSLDEETLYVRAKPNLVKLRAFVARLRQSAPSHRLSSTDGMILEDLLRQLDHYIAAATSAIEMATVDVNLARTHMVAANVAYTQVNDAFLSLVESSRSDATAAIAKALRAADEQSVRFDVAIAIGSVVFVLFGWAVSRALVRDLTGMTRDMTALASGDVAIEIQRTGRKDEIGAMARALEVFRENALKIRQNEVELRRAHDELELRVAERTTELHRANEELVAAMAEQKRTESALRESEQRIRNVTANMPGMVFQKIKHPDGRVEIPFISEGVERIHGLRAEDVMARPELLAKLIHPDDIDKYLSAIRQSLKTLEPGSAEFRGFDRRGEIRWLRADFHPRRRDDGAMVWEEVATDITREKEAQEERAKLEGQLRQAQKMESLGTLAGGIAHEFNNMLVPIRGLTELTLMELPQDGDARENLTRVIENVGRAAQLVDKILAFSRAEEGEAASEPSMIRTVVDDAVGLLRATLPATVSISTDFTPTGARVNADETQLHQILMNLCNNAVHAMEGGVGELAIGLAIVDFATGFRGRHAQLQPGSYAKLSVRDTGHGMDDTTMARIFDPFFTTKEVGEGTGLGLTVIHGIVGTHGGGIDAASNPGRGTTFDVYLPVIEEARHAVAVNA